MINTLWPEPPELEFMTDQFRLGYFQARNDGLAKITVLENRIHELETNVENWSDIAKDFMQRMRDAI